LQSNYLLASAITVGIGFLINSAVLFLVLLRGRQKQHYLFAAVLACFAIGSLSIFLFLSETATLTS
jgi:hypothetical protein